MDNLRSTDGKYRVYIKLAIPSMILTVISLWLPYEAIRDSGRFGRYFMILVLFFIGQIQSYVQGWVNTARYDAKHARTYKDNGDNKHYLFHGVHTGQHLLSVNG